MEVAAWLCGLGLGQYEQAFRENDIDAEVLMDLTAEDLIGLGVASIGHRRKLLAAVAALRAGPTAAARRPHPGPPFCHARRRRCIREGLACTRGRAPPAHRDVCRPGRLDRAC